MPTKVALAANSSQLGRTAVSGAEGSAKDGQLLACRCHLDGFGFCDYVHDSQQS